MTLSLQELLELSHLRDDLQSRLNQFHTLNDKQRPCIGDDYRQAERWIRLLTKIVEGRLAPLPPKNA